MPKATNDVQMKLYPRGYLGAVLGQRIQRSSGLRESNQGFVQQRFSVLKDQNDFNVGNPTIDALYGRYVRDWDSMRNFEFREAILKAALAAFGTSDFRMWYSAQLQSPAAGDLHVRFLDDTLKFIDNNRRDVMLETWQRLLNAAGENALDSVELNDNALQFFGTDSPKLRDILQRWCSRENGFQDLLGTLFILFGSAQS